MTTATQIDGQGDPLAVFPPDAEEVLARLEQDEFWKPSEEPAMRVLRKGLLPVMSGEELALLRQALLEDDRDLIQGFTTEPLPYPHTLREPVAAACLTAFGPWKTRGLETVGQVEDAFAARAVEIDARLGEPAACGWLWRWWDHTDRERVRAKLLIEIGKELAARAALQGGG